MKKVKLLFLHKTYTFEGLTSCLICTVALMSIGHCINRKTFLTKITLKEGDKKDYNEAIRILNALNEIKAYNWAKKIIEQRRKTHQEILDSYDLFIEKANRTIWHNTDYLERND